MRSHLSVPRGTQKVATTFDDIQDVPGLNDQAPPSPNRASTHQRAILCEGELLRWPRQV
jgi:hypothetical protein